jgi:parvulin-like peptidyl-prolyl isomerase
MAMNVTQHRAPLAPQHGRSTLQVLLAVALLGGLAITAGLALGPKQGGGEAPGIVVRVNGQDLSLDELRRVKTDLLESARLQGQTNDKLPDADKFDELAVQSLVERHLLLQEAARRHLSVSDDELDAAIGELRRRFPDLESFGAWMQERGLGDVLLFDTVRADLLVRRVTAALSDGVQITDEQLANYYDAHKENLIVGQQVRLGIIAINSVEAGEAILRALREGVNFRRLAREYSVGQRAAEGGDTGWIDVQTLPQPMREVVDALQEGEASRPVKKNDDEYLIIALSGRRPVHATTLDEARAVIGRQLLAAEKQKAVLEWLAEQKANSTIEILL